MEENLPLIFQYIEKKKNIINDKEKKDLVYYLDSTTLDTNFLLKRKPFKHLVRLL